MWLAERVHGVESRSTGETPAGRLVVERDFLSPSPRARFHTDCVEIRRVHNAWPFVTIDANRYSIPPEALGHKVEIRRRVDGDTVEIRLAVRLIATHRLVAGRRVDVWDPIHKQAAETLALGWDPNGPDLRLVESKPVSASVERLELAGDYDIEPPDLDDRYTITINDGKVSG